MAVAVLATYIVEKGKPLVVMVKCAPFGFSDHHEGDGEDRSQRQHRDELMEAIA